MKRKRKEENHFQREFLSSLLLQREEKVEREREKIYHHSSVHSFLITSNERIFFPPFLNMKRMKEKGKSEIFHLICIPRYKDCDCGRNSHPVSDQ